MDTIPSIFWMIIIALLTGFICFVLYQLAMLLKESKNAVSETKKIVVDAQETLKTLNGIINDVEEMVGTIKGTVYQVNDAIIVPIRKITSIVGVASGFIEGITSKRSR